MWVLTPTGFFSAIAFDARKGKADLKRIPADPDDTLIVRARVEADIVALAEELDVEWWSDDHADYMFRAFVTRDQWKAFLSAQTDEIDYVNFKNEVTRRQGKGRHDVYMRVWSALLSLQPAPKRTSWRWPGMADTRRVPLPEAPPEVDVWASSDEDFLHWMEREGDRPLTVRDLHAMTDAEYEAFEKGL